MENNSARHGAPVRRRFFFFFSPPRAELHSRGGNIRVEISLLSPAPIFVTPGSALFPRWTMGHSSQPVGQQHGPLRRIPPTPTPATVVLLTGNGRRAHLASPEQHTSAIAIIEKAWRGVPRRAAGCRHLPFKSLPRQRFVETASGLRANELLHFEFFLAFVFPPSTTFPSLFPCAYPPTPTLPYLSISLPIPPSCSSFSLSLSLNPPFSAPSFPRSEVPASAISHCSGSCQGGSQAFRAPTNKTEFSPGMARYLPCFCCRLRNIQKTPVGQQHLTNKLEFRLSAVSSDERQGDSFRFRFVRRVSGNPCQATPKAPTAKLISAGTDTIAVIYSQSPSAARPIRSFSSYRPPGSQSPIVQSRELKDSLGQAINRTKNISLNHYHLASL